MATAQLTPHTAERLNELTIVMDQIRRLNERAEALKWEVLDSREAGVQTAIAKIYGVRRQAVGQWVTNRRKKPESAT